MRGEPDPEATSNVDLTEYCPLCGDPLPLDGACTCAGTDIDPTTPANRLGRNFVFTYRHGNTRTYRRKEGARAR